MTFAEIPIDSSTRERGQREGRQKVYLFYYSSLFHHKRRFFFCSRRRRGKSSTSNRPIKIFSFFLLAILLARGVMTIGTEECEQLR